MSEDRVQVRPARAGEAQAVAPLLYAVNPELHDRFAGGRELAMRLITQAFENPGYSGSAEVVRVAEVDSRPAGVIACYPDWEGGPRGRADIRLGLRMSSLPHRPFLLAFVFGMRRALPGSPREALYVDALATAPEYRRQGVARALLAATEAEARRTGLIRIALETEVDNGPARSLYESCGFIPSGDGRRIRGVPRFVSYVRELGARRGAPTRPAP